MGEFRMKEYLEKLAKGQNLVAEEMSRAAQSLFSEDISDSEIAAFMLGLKAKGETAEEIAVLAEAMRSHSRKVQTTVQAMDNCGTGGDGSQSFNISTTSAFVLAGGGIKVAKHGNRSVSSKTGSADVLEQLGVDLYLEPEKMEVLLEEIGITFLFAQSMHPKTAQIMKVRRELKIPTVFNILGPLTNPVSLKTQLLGINRRDMLETIAESLYQLGRERAVVVNGAGYMDEASLQGDNSIVVLDNGKLTTITLHPEDVDLPVYSNEAIKGGDKVENAAILLELLKGKKGPYRDTVLLNAGLGFFANGKAKTIKEGIALAEESIDSGAALAKLEALITYSQLNKVVY